MDSIRAANETLNSVDVHKAPVKGTEKKSTHRWCMLVCTICICGRTWWCVPFASKLVFCFALPCLTYMSYVWLWIGMFTACGLWAHIIPYAIQTHTHIELSSWARSRSFDYLFLSRLFHCIRLAVCFVLLWCCWFVVCVFFYFCVFRVLHYYLLVFFIVDYYDYF